MNVRGDALQKQGFDDLTEGHGYHPAIQDFGLLLDSVADAQVLFLGNQIQDLDYGSVDVRHVRDPDVLLPSGVYWFHDQDVLRMMCVSSIEEPVESESIPRSVTDPAHPLVAAGGWHRALWPDALVVHSPKYFIGQTVMKKNTRQDTTVRNRHWSVGGWVYVVSIDGRSLNLGEVELSEPPPDDDVTEWVTRDPAPVEEFAATLTRKKLESLFTDTVFSFRATRTIFRPYQFKPIIKLLQTGKSRLLIADEVGLGKTIEAGLIWTELEARKNANRVLIVTPSSLVGKWRNEMENRFNFELTELDGKTLPEFEAKVETGRLPARGAYIASLNKLRSWDNLSNLVGLLKFDLIVFDEAHALRNAATKSYALGGLLSSMTDSLVFLSATPLNLHNRDLFNLLELLSPGEFGDTQAMQEQMQPNRTLHAVSLSLNDRSLRAHDRVQILHSVDADPFGVALLGRPEFKFLEEILEADSLTPSQIVEARRYLADLNALSAVLTRTRKAEVDDQKALREAHQVDVHWEDAERNFYREYYAWCKARADASGAAIGFSMQMPLRLASACLPAARDTVLNWGPSALDPLDDSEKALRPKKSGSISPHAELITAAKELGNVDTKYDEVLKKVLELKSQNKQALLFTFSLPTLAYLKNRLSPHVRVAVLSGQVKKDERAKIIESFRAGAYDLVLANRVASEGLDFEFCSAVINYDLPWNPMEVEQRIGRIDRIGQQEDKILIFNFYSDETIDEKIMMKVLERIGLFESAIGEMEPIVFDEWKKSKDEILNFNLTEEQREARLHQMELAIEAQHQGVESVTDASSFLLTSNDVDINGMEEELLKTGRYVGGSELYKLIADWARVSGAPAVRLAPDGKSITVRGNAKMAQNLQGLIKDGVRNSSEMQNLVGQFQSELEVNFLLDQELARTSGGQLLSPSHSTVLAALNVQRYQQSKYASVKAYAETTEVQPGKYLLQLSVASWGGPRPGVEIWAEGVDEKGRTAPRELLDILLSNLASGKLDQGQSDWDTQLRTKLVAETSSRMRDRSTRESERKIFQSGSLLESRRVNAISLHERKRSSILGLMRTLKERGLTNMIPAAEGRLRQVDLNHQVLMHDLETNTTPGLNYEDFAVCEIEVVHGQC